LASDNIEHDHFPVPERAGGTETVPSCRTCHDLKDRFRQVDWPKELLEAAQIEMQKLIRDEARRAGIITNEQIGDNLAAYVGIVYSSPELVLKNWSRCSRETRLLAAKWLAVEAELRDEAQRAPAIGDDFGDPVLEPDGEPSLITDLQEHAHGLIVPDDIVEPIG
jgi:hypothetical protein